MNLFLILKYFLTWQIKKYKCVITCETYFKVDLKSYIIEVKSH